MRQVTRSDRLSFLLTTFENMKPLNAFIGVFALILLSNIYRGLTEGFATNRQALIAGVLTTIGIILMVAMIVRERAKQTKQ